MISVMMPWKENVRGTSALPYHLLVHRDKSNKVILFSYNMNRLSEGQIKQAAEELNIEIQVLPIPKWYTAFFRFHLLFLRIFLPVPIGNYLKLSDDEVQKVVNSKPDGIWIYGEELSNVSRQFSNYKRVHTLPDCESLYYYRLLGNRIGLSSIRKYWRYAFMYPKYVTMEKQFDDSLNVHYHLVGDADAEMLRIINPLAQSHFIRHPHYEVPLIGKIFFHQPKVKILIAGQNDLYMANDAESLVNALCVSANDLKDNFVFTFLGRGWNEHAERMNTLGLETHVITFADDYTAEVCSHDVQIVPISIGTGTKGKVLDAFASGLLVIGSWYAMENIAVNNGEDCIIYKTPNDVPDVLRKIAFNPVRFEQIAKNGREKILKYHSRTEISKQMFRLFK